MQLKLTTSVSSSRSCDVRTTARRLSLFLPVHFWSVAFVCLSVRRTITFTIPGLEISFLLHLYVLVTETRSSCVKVIGSWSRSRQQVGLKLKSLVTDFWLKCGLVFAKYRSVSGCRHEGLEQFAGRRRIFCVPLHLLPPTEDFLLAQSCPWVGLTHGLGWVGLGQLQQKY